MNKPKEIWDIVPLSDRDCPLDNCDGKLHMPAQINDEPQYCITCNKCQWFDIIIPHKSNIKEAQKWYKEFNNG